MSADTRRSDNKETREYGYTGKELVCVISSVIKAQKGLQRTSQCRLLARSDYLTLDVMSAPVCPQE